MAPGLQGCEWSAGYEVGAEGTPHIQGYVEFPVKVRPIGYKGMPKEVHWGDKYGKPCKGTRMENVRYTIKEGNPVAESTLRAPRPLPEITLYGWQLEAKVLMEMEPDDRTIYWYWSRDGAMGKSSLVRWAVRNLKAIVCGGKAGDMKYMIAKYIENRGDYPDVVIFDLPRHQATPVDFAGIEEIKNGVFASTKYESGMVEMPWPHVFVFANWEMPTDRHAHMSKDRFVVTDIEEWVVRNASGGPCGGQAQPTARCTGQEFAYGDSSDA